MTDTTHLPSGRFLLRIDPQLHAELRRAAERAGLSLNEYCARCLRAPGSDMAAVEGAVEAVERALHLVGDSLLGVLVFGSWARREADADSDVDLLLVIDDRVELDRDLYRRWDALPPILWHGRPVEPHFVHLPAPDDPPSSLWAEVAVDGIVLHDGDLSVSAHLNGVRRAIADGRLVRKTTHGQSYWVRAA